MDESVEVIDMTFETTTPGLTLHHTVRAHEGDVVSETAEGGIRIVFGPREVFVGNEKRTLPGEKVLIQGAHVVEMRVKTRFEQRVRPSAKALKNREQAELDALKQRLGVATPA